MKELLLADAPSQGAPEASSANSEMTRRAGPPLWLVPPVVTLAVMLWGIQRASYSWDEASTMSAVQRPFHALVRMLGHVDAVHGAYYVIMWPIVQLFGPGELATRLPSAVAMALAAAAIFGLGRRLVSPRAGLAAGLVFAILPQVDLYGQTARPYAMATALAAIASYLLVRAIQAAAAGRLGRMRGWLAGYGACLAALGYIHMFGLLLAAAHVVPVARTWIRDPRRRSGRWLALTWLVVVVAAAAAVSPVVFAGVNQVGTGLSCGSCHRGHSYHWAGPGSLLDLAGLIGPGPMAAAAGLIVLCAITVGAFAGRARLRADWPGDLIAVCVPWLIVPAAILIVVSSLFTPVFVFRYILFCAPAAALLVGAGLAAPGWRAGTAALAVVVALAIPALLQIRTDSGHADDIRGADQIVAANMRPGDAFIYLTVRQSIEMAYPYGLRQLTNVALGETPSMSGSLGGTWAPLPLVQQRLQKARRIWFVQIAIGRYQTSPGRPPKVLQNLDFKEARTWHTTGIWLTLYVRRDNR